MKNAPHLSEQELESLLFGDPDSGNSHSRKAYLMSKHLDDCQRCQRAITSLAAPADLWQMFRETTFGASGDGSPNESSSLFGVGAVQDDAADRSRLDLFRRLFDPPLRPENLAQLDHYEIEREIGHGGMGVVFKAFDTELERSIAIKVLVPGLQTSETTRKRFGREARAVAAVSHPNVIPVYSVNLRGSIPYFTMALIEGSSLRKMVDAQGPLEEPEIIRIATQIASGLEAAHSRQLIHRDIKPSNILVENDSGRALLTDFGLAEKNESSSLTPAGWTAGTPGCMSPEQVNGQLLDARSDLFSLGGVIYFMATGRLPFEANSRYVSAKMICENAHLPTRNSNPDISTGLAGIIDCCLAKNPAKRFQSAEQLRQSLTRLSADPHDSSPPASQVTNGEPEAARLEPRSFDVGQSASDAPLGQYCSDFSLSTRAGLPNLAPNQSTPCRQKATTRIAHQPCLPSRNLAN